MSRRERGRTRLPVRPEINVTSLVDVAFTLLVIFIITAPVLQGGVEVNVPVARVGVIEASVDQIIVSIQADGSVSLGDTQVEAAAVEEILSQMISARDVDAIYVKGDSLALYGRVLPVISAVARQEGVALWLIGVDIP